jgi:hypothetical protein
MTLPYGKKSSLLVAAYIASGKDLVFDVFPYINKIQGGFVNLQHL